MVTPVVSRSDIVRFRFRRHQLHRLPGTATGPTDIELLGYGVQDTGTDGAGWALTVRGAGAFGPDDLALAWTLRGAPHAYRRGELGAVTVATAPWSEADAAKRIYDAARPLKAAGIPVLEALRTVARHLREIAGQPVVKGEASARLTEVLDQPYLRYCRPCAATHVYEMPFRLAALQAALELEPDTSPPVMRPIPGLVPGSFEHLADEADPDHDVIRNHLRFYGPTRPRDVAAFLDAPLKEVKARWPSDAVEVRVTEVLAQARSQPRFSLAADVDELEAGGEAGPRAWRLVGPYDPYLQLRDRELLVAEESRRKDLWRVLGRPGAVVADGEIVGTWRPRASGGRLTVRIEPWKPLRSPERALIEEQAERLAAHRGITLAAVSEE